MMNTWNWIRQIMILTAFALVAVAAAGAETAGERYIVILKSRSGPAPDVARLGGTITFRQADQVNVTLPREAVAALRADPLVRYIQAVAGGEGAPLIGEPEEPTPRAPRRLAPHATAGNQSWSRSYSYDDAGNITNIGSQQFVYDALGRLTEMATSGTSTEQYGYDRYGNQTSRSSGGVPQPPMDADATTNRLMPSTGYSYDRGGNVISGDSYTLSYDALGQAATKTYTAATTFNETYIYTAGEERIGVQTANSAETSSWWYWSVRDEGGKVLRQYRSSALDPTQTALWIEDYVYRDGLLVGAERPPTLGGRRHFHIDHLGSPRLITSNDGQIVSIHDYLPFGGETTSVYQETGSGFDREDPMKFTGHERDYAGGFGREGGGDPIDYMHARFENGSLGRFLSVDPITGSSNDPQSWNRYTYVKNRPLNFTDRDGRQISITVIAPQPVIDPVYVAEKERQFRLWVLDTILYHITESYHSFDRKVQGFEHTVAVGWRGQNPNCGSDAECVDFFYQYGGIYDIGGDVAAPSKIFNEGQRALVELAKKAARTGISKEEAMILIRWARELGIHYENHIGPEAAAHWVGGSHIRIGPINHIPVRP